MRLVCSFSSIFPRFSLEGQLVLGELNLRRLNVRHLDRHVEDILTLCPHHWCLYAVEKMEKKGGKKGQGEEKKMRRSRACVCVALRFGVYLCAMCLSTCLAVCLEVCLAVCFLSPRFSSLLPGAGANGKYWKKAKATERCAEF